MQLAGEGEEPRGPRFRMSSESGEAAATARRTLTCKVVAIYNLRPTLGPVLIDDQLNRFQFT